MRVCFFGSEEFSIPTFSALLNSGHEVVCAVTRADKKKGRGMEVSSTPVALYALKNELPVLKPENFLTEEFNKELFSFSPDVIVVCAYGKILKKGILSCPIKGCINVHPSLLPKYRGATPVESALRAGDSVTGVTIFYMDEGCDTGDIILQREFPIDPEDTRGSLREKLSFFAADVLIEALEMVERGTAKRMPQPPGGACNTTLIKDTELEIDWNLSAKEVINFTRSLWPSPAALTYFKGRRIQVGVPEMHSGNGEPGTIIDIIKNRGPVVACGTGSVILREVKPEGKKIMPASSWCCGVSPKKGERFGRE